MDDTAVNTAKRIIGKGNIYLESAKRIGILGGTFDPIHNGHLAVAEHVRELLALDKVILIPAGQPWLKAGRAVSASEHRLAMAQMAVASVNLLDVSDIEIERAGPTYTVDTLAELRRVTGNRVAVYLIIGMDSARELRRWREPERLFDMCTVAAVSRPEIEDVSVEEMALTFPTSRGRFCLVHGLRVDVSATDIRRRVVAGLPIDALTPPSVAEYISEHKLYTARL